MTKHHHPTLCAEPRSLKPLCVHLGFEKGAVCKKGIPLAQDVIYLIPADDKECVHFSLEPVEEEAPSKVRKNKRRSRKKKASEEVPSGEGSVVITEEEKE